MSSQDSVSGVRALANVPSVVAPIAYRVVTATSVAMPRGGATFLVVILPSEAPSTQAVGIHRLLVAPLAQGYSHRSVVLRTVVLVVLFAVHGHVSIKDQGANQVDHRFFG